MNRYQRENPSFSSTLLDSIYRSIDESNGKGEEELILYRETMRKKHNNGNGLKDEAAISNKTSLKKACMIEKWMEEKVSYETRRKSFNQHPVLLNSSSSSSESSCGGGFSSSESESTNYTMQRPKPIRTSVSEVGKYNNHAPKPNNNNKHEGSFVKTKSKALKIYGDLKKVKQPISPGGRFASFINSLFTARNHEKKPKINMSEQPSSTCSSASSFSRSCLSKTPSSRGNNNGAKRSVRFYPVSVIVDEDGHKSLYTTTDTTNEDLKFHVMNESRRVEQVARDLLKNYQKKKQQDFDKNVRRYSDQQADQDDMDDDDDASYASSDLFELDNIGIERYREELPVYETTHLGTNRAIANGLIL